MAALRTCVVQPEWDTWARKKVYMDVAEQTKRTFLQGSYWRKLKVVVDITEKVFVVLRKLDTDKPTTGIHYGLWYELVEETKKIRIVPGILTVRHIQILTRIVNDRWQMCHAHLHSAGFSLNPRMQKTGYALKLPPNDRLELKRGLKEVIRKFHPQSIVMRRKCLLEYTSFINEENGMGETDAIADATSEIEPALWWQIHGDAAPNIQKIAMKVLSQTTCASSCERNWSQQKYVQGRTGTLLPGNFDKRVFIYNNTRLERKLAMEGVANCEVWDDPSDSSGKEQEEPTKTCSGDVDVDDDCDEGVAM